MAGETAAAAGRRPRPHIPHGMALEALTRLAEQSLEGIGVLDEDLRFLYVNPAGCDILGRRQEELVGSSSLLVTPERWTLPEARSALEGQPARQQAVIVRPDGSEREVEYTANALDVDGRRLVTGIFRDVTDARRAERWATAFARITSKIASSTASEAILDELSRSVVEATGMAGCAAILFDHGPDRFRVVGTHGLPGDYGRRLEEALASDADLPSRRAFATRCTVVVRRTPDDPVLELDRALGSGVPWEAIACAPMMVAGRAVGVLKGFLQAALPPTDDVLGFLDAIGDQAAVVVENSRLFAEATESSRRQEVLVQAGLTLAVELSLPNVLAKIVKFACAVADATYGALGVLDAEGGLEDFITSGVSDAQRAAIGQLPRGRGLLGALIRDAHPVRLRRLQDDPRSGGFPDGHPPMSSFLGVPVTVRGKVYGNLYLTEKRGGAAFTEADERAVVTLAAQAGVAIENARLFAEAQDRLALEERTRLARELHDSVSQALFAMTLETGAAQVALQNADLDAAGLGVRLERLRELTEGALAEMRALIFALRPEAIREEGLVAAVRKQADGIAAREDLDVTVDAPDGRLPVPLDVEEQLYRLAQEALSNVVRHAGARRVQVRIHVDPGAELRLEIEDDGVGFDASLPRPGHLGLRSMAQRVESLGGRLVLSTGGGRGTIVGAVVPLPASRGRDERPPEGVRA
jgi:PAS domain S-box-containing protein